jgi:hypothetical protein
VTDLRRDERSLFLTTIISGFSHATWQVLASGRRRISRYEEQGASNSTQNSCSSLFLASSPAWLQLGGLFAGSSAVIISGHPFGSVLSRDYWTPRFWIWLLDLA